jgi:hypothetical protein
MAGIARAPPTSMTQKMPRKTADSSQCRDATANLGTQKAQQSMRLECCHGAAPLLWDEENGWQRLPQKRPAIAVDGSSNQVDKSLLQFSLFFAFL